MQIRKEVVQSLIDKLAPLDKLSRKKVLSDEEGAVLDKGVIVAMRSVLAILRKLK